MRFVSFRFCRITHLLGCAWYWIGRQDQDAYGTVPAMNGWVAGGGGGTWSTNSSVYTFYLLAFHSVNPKLANLVRKHGLFEPFISKMHHFTKTGSGTNIGKALKKRVAFSQGDGVQTAQTDLELLFSIVAVRKRPFC
jgi:hypothetical protein